MDPTFTLQEIKYWLAGWLMVNGEGRVIGALDLADILNLLDCEQDGIEALLERRRPYTMDELAAETDRMLAMLPQ